MADDGRHGSWLALILVGGAVAIALALAAWEIASPPVPAPIPAGSSPVAVFEADVLTGQEQVAALRRELQHLVAEQRRTAAALVDPGPEPPWYHPLDHAAWSSRRVAWDQALTAATAAHDRVQAAQQRLEAGLHLLTDRERLAELARAACARPAPEGLPGPLREALRYVWNALVRPILHWLLVAALLLFAVNRLLRLALIQGWLGEERL